jgi:hypothetical protein
MKLKTTKNKTNSPPLITPIDGTNITIDFLLKEYGRLIEYQKITIDDITRWFNIYIGVASAAFVLLVPLAQTLNTGNEPLIRDIILFGLLFVGVTNFIGLTNANATNIHYERAIRLIQKYFIERDTITKDFLYFETRNIGIKGSGVRALIIRGLMGGAPRPC